MARTRKTVIKKKEKKWFKIFSPKIFGENEIGRTPATEGSKVIGRNLKTTLGLIMNDPTKHRILITLRVNSVKEQNARTHVVYYKLDPAYKKRMIRRNTTLITINQVLLTKDDKKIRIQAFLVTSHRVKGKQEKDLRKALMNEVKNFVGETQYEEILKKCASKKIQSEMKKKLNKIYPLNHVEIDKIVLMNK